MESNRRPDAIEVRSILPHSADLLDCKGMGQGSTMIGLLN